MPCNLFEIEIFNRNYIVKKFEGLKNPETESKFIDEFKKLIIKYNKSIQKEIEESSQKYIKDIANMILKYMFNFKELKKINYFFISPEIKKEKIEIYIKANSIKQDFVGKTLIYFIDYIENYKGKIEAVELTKKCSEYLYANKKDLKNTDVFKLLKFVLVGHDESPLFLSEICQVLGKENILERLKRIHFILKS